MIKYLLFDIDDTLLDFKKGELFAIQKTFFDHGIILTEEMIKYYIDINMSLWKKLEKNEITKEDVLKGRFKIFVNKFNLNLDYYPLDEEYRGNLADHPFLIDGALELLIDLKDSYNIYLITNGIKKTQERRLSLTGIDKLVKGVFISEEMGTNKPHIEYFNKVFESIPDFKKEEALVIGDSLTSDIKGANNAGLKCVYFKHHDEDLSNYKIDYIIENLNDLYDVLRRE